MSAEVFIASRFSQVHIENSPLSAVQTESMREWVTQIELAWSPKRRNDWLAGRYCAKRAMEKLGLTPAPFYSRENRAPDWPEGVVGSISHANGMAASAVSVAAKGVGIDCEELIEPSRLEKIAPIILHPREKSLLASWGVWGGSLIFSAKESLYKNVSPRARAFFDFKEAAVLQVEGSRFWIELASDQAMLAPFLGVYQGSFQLHENFIITLIESV